MLKHDRSAARGRQGLTLVEMLVALAVSGVVLGMAHQLVVAMTGHLERLRRSSQAHGVEMNARRWIRAASGSLVSATDSTPFYGTDTSVTFSARVRRAGGWYEPERVHLALQGSNLVAFRNPHETLVLASPVASLSIDYGVGSDRGLIWYRVWQSFGRAPSLMRLRIGRNNGDTVDTLIYVIRDHQ